MPFSKKTVLGAGVSGTDVVTGAGAGTGAGIGAGTGAGIGTGTGTGVLPWYWVNGICVACPVVIGPDDNAGGFSLIRIFPSQHS